MTAFHKYTFQFYYRPLNHAGVPVSARRTVGGLNALDAECRLRKILHREGNRLHLINDVQCITSPQKPPETLPGFEVMVDAANHAKRLLANLEARLA